MVSVQHWIVTSSFFILNLVESGVAILLHYHDGVSHLEKDKMSDSYEIIAEPRSEIGKGASRRMRRLENKIPAIVYGNEKNPEMICLDHNTFAKALENEGFYSHILTLKVGQGTQQVVLKDLLRHPSRPRVLHADFQRVSAKTKITLSIPIHFKGQEESPGVKNQGGVVSHLMTEVEVRCLPANLPEFIEVDMSSLSIGDSIQLSELKLPKGVEFTALLHGKETDLPVATIHKPVVNVEPEEVSSEEISSPEASQKPEDGAEEA